jgi:hypothetical protein
MDENTYRTLSVFLTPVLTAAITGIVAAAAALLAVRYEAGQAAKRAREEQSGEALVAALSATHADLIRGLYAVANSLMIPGKSQLRVPPLSMDMPLVGDANALKKVLELQTAFSLRPAGTGLAKADLEAIAEANEELSRAVQRQVDRIRDGKDPARIRPEEIEATLRSGMEQLGKTMP